jgi:hypothetical protein
MKIALACATIAGKGHGHFAFPLQLMGKRHAIGNGQLRTKVADHAAYMVFPCAKMKASLTPLAIAILIALPLHKKLTKRHISTGKYAKVAVQGHYPFIGIKRHGYPGRNGLLPYSAEPLGYFSLPEQHQHFFLDHPGQKQPAVYGNQFLVCQIFTVVKHGLQVTSFGFEVSGLKFD